MIKDNLVICYFLLSRYISFKRNNIISRFKSLYKITIQKYYYYLKIKKNNKNKNNSVTGPSENIIFPVFPIKSDFNAEQHKAQILSDNKNKSGIYMFTNLKKW